MFFVYHQCKLGGRNELLIAMCSKPKSNKERHVNQRNMNLIAKQGTVALHGPRGTQHIRCAFGPFVALSHVPVRLDAQKGKLYPPPYSHGR